MWGGAIEIQILADYYNCEIFAIDTESLSTLRFGVDKGYIQRVYLIYSGIHYDLVAKNSDESNPEETDVTVFEPSDFQTWQEVVNLGRILQSQN